MNAHNSNSTPDSILTQIAAIKRLEAGKLSIIRQGPNGPYYNLQHREAGHNHTEYVPNAELPQAQAHVEAYQEVSQLFEQYVNTVSEISRKERKGGDKKKRSTPRPSQSPAKRKSKS